MGFGGKFGLQTDRQDKSVNEWDNRESSLNNFKGFYNYNIIQIFS